MSPGQADELLDVERAKLRALQAAELRDLVALWKELSPTLWPDARRLQGRIAKLLQWAGDP